MLSLFLVLGLGCVVSAQRFIDENLFASAATFNTHLTELVNLGLRATGSPRHYAFIEYLDRIIQTIPAVNVSYNYYDLYKWNTANDQTLYEAGHLSLSSAGINTTLEVAGAVPFSFPNKQKPATGELVYIPYGVTNFSSYNLTGRILLRDYNYQQTSIPYSLVEFTGIYETPDYTELLNSSFERPFLNEAQPTTDMVAAGRAGAIGYICGFDLPRQVVQSSYYPSEGTHFRIPGVFVGAEELDVLKAAVGTSTQASVTVDGVAEYGFTKEIFATLPGMTEDTIYIVSHTDGNTAVQDNGPIALLTLLQYFAAQPLSTRNKTLTFVFTAGHLTLAREGDFMLARALNATYDFDKTAFVIPLEHMGTREIFARNRTDGGPGRELYFSGKNEVMLWSVGPVEPARNAVIEAVKHRNLDRVLVSNGLSVPNTSQVPYFTSFGGLGTYFNENLLPTSAIISGPWSLFQPAYGVSAVNVPRFRNQTLAFGDVILALDPYSKNELAGNYTMFRQMRAEGFPSVDISPLKPEHFAPGYFTDKPYF